MTTPKVFELDGSTLVFPSDVPIKGIDYVAVYISSIGTSNSFNVVARENYSVVNDSVVFTVPPIGKFLRLVVGTNRNDLLNAPSVLSNVSANMDAIVLVSKNISAIIDAYALVATAENISAITSLGLVANSIVNVNNIKDSIVSLDSIKEAITLLSSSKANIDEVATIVSDISSILEAKDNVNLVGINISRVNQVGNNIDIIDAVHRYLSKVIIVGNDLLRPIPNINKVADSITNVDLVGNDISNVNLIAQNLNSIINRSKFKVKSISSLSLDLKTNPKSPILTALPDMVGFEINTSTNSIKNVSGRDIDIIGTMSIQISTTSTSGVIIYVYSETSSDGITWTMNAESLRKTKLDKDGTDYVTFPSMLISNRWVNGTWVRFRFYKEGVGDAILNTVSDTVSGSSITGSSFLWALHEL